MLVLGKWHWSSTEHVANSFHAYQLQVCMWPGGGGVGGLGGGVGFSFSQTYILHMLKLESLVILKIIQFFYVH